MNWKVSDSTSEVRSLTKYDKEFRKVLRWFSTVMNSRIIKEDIITVDSKSYCKEIFENGVTLTLYVTHLSSKGTPKGWVATQIEFKQGLLKTLTTKEDLINLLKENQVYNDTSFIAEPFNSIFSMHLVSPLLRKIVAACKVSLEFQFNIEDTPVKLIPRKVPVFLKLKVSDQLKSRDSLYTVLTRIKLIETSFLSVKYMTDFKEMILNNDSIIYNFIDKRNLWTCW